MARLSPNRGVKRRLAFTEHATHMHAIRARSSDGPEWNGRSEHACKCRVGAAGRAMPQEPVVRSYQRQPDLHISRQQCWHDACTCTTRAPSLSSPPGRWQIHLGGAEYRKTGRAFLSVGRAADHDLDAMVPSGLARGPRQFGWLWLVARSGVRSAGASHDAWLGSSIWLLRISQRKASDGTGLDW